MDIASPPASPFGLFAAWVRAAQASEPHDALGASLATVDAKGAPNWRMILVKAWPSADDNATAGFVFFTNTESTKAAELALGRAALGWHWKSLRRQIRARGSLEPVDDKAADAYFTTRSRASQISAWASKQSAPLQEPAELAKRVAAANAEFQDKDVPRPPFWVGYALVPTEIEFWQDGAARLHERLRYVRATPRAKWQPTRLYP